MNELAHLKKNKSMLGHGLNRLELIYCGGLVNQGPWIEEPELRRTQLHVHVPDIVNSALTFALQLRKDEYQIIVEIRKLI